MGRVFNDEMTLLTQKSDLQSPAGAATRHT